MARRSYGSGRLFVVADRGGGESWCGSWWAGGVRVKRKLGPKRRAGRSDGLTRTQAEAELRRHIDTVAVLAGPQRRTVEEATSQSPAVLSARRVDSVGGLGDGDDAGGGSAKALVGRDQGGVERRCEGNVERVAGRDPVDQRPRG